MDPVMLSPGPLEIRWYGLCFALAFLFGQGYMQWRLKEDEQKGRLVGALEHLDSLLIWIVVGTVLGARLGHCLFYDPDYYLSRPWEIPMVWQGGLASHGGLMGFLLSLSLFSKKKKVPFWPILDRLAVPAALGGALIRLGNFFNSEIVGTSSDLPWAVVFARVDAVPRHPVQLYESLSYAAIALLLFVADRRGLAGKKHSGRLTGLFLVMAFSMRLFLELFKTSQASWISGFPLSMGQMLSLPVVMAGAFLLAKPRV